MLIKKWGRGVFTIQGIRQHSENITTVSKVIVIVIVMMQYNNMFLYYGTES